MKNKKIRFLYFYFPSTKRVLDALCFVYGVNRFFSLGLCKVCGFSVMTKLYNVDLKKLQYISEFLVNFFLIERGLKKYRKSILFKFKENGSYGGYRLFMGMPVNGQRSHTNAKTVRKFFKKILN